MGLSNLFDKLFKKQNETENVSRETLLFERVDDDAVQTDAIKEEYAFDDPDNPTRMALNVPVILPLESDRTIEFWLERLKFWGKPIIQYVGIDGRKRKATQQEFEDAMLGTNEIFTVFGKWFFTLKDYKSFETSREVYDEHGSKKKETFIVTIDLDKDLEKAFKGKF